MKRRWVLVVPMLALAACGSEDSSPASADAVAERAAAVGVDPSAVYAVTVDGFAPAPQSVGVMGDAGFSAAYSSPEGGIAMLTTDPRGMTDDDCADRPLATAGGASSFVECTPDDDGWYRVSGDQHEYVALHDGVAVGLSTAIGAIDEDTLRDAVVGAHPPSSEELDALFPGGDGGGPVERGDLPPEGDGAPIDGGETGAAG